VLLPLITLALGFVASYLLELFRNRWTTQNTQEVRNLLNGVNAIAIAQAKAEAARLDWRETNSGQEPRAVAMHANARCSHESALLLHPPVIEAVERLTTAAYPMYWPRESGRDPRHNSEFYGAATAATRAIATRLRELYGFAASGG
jgi:hypothetical protein